MSYWVDGARVRRKSDGSKGTLKKCPGWELCFVEVDGGALLAVYSDMLDHYYELIYSDHPSAPPEPE